MATQELSIQRKVTVPEQASKIVKSKFEIIRLKLRVLRQFFSIIVNKTGSPIAALRLIKQIREKDYAKPYIGQGLEIYLVGINFSSQQKAVDGWLMEQ